MDQGQILSWLRETRESELAVLWKMADRVREEHVGSDVLVRGLIEFSNCCRRSCHYCGLRFPNRKITRYRMSREEIMGCVSTAVKMGYGTVVLQSGEDPEFSVQWMVELIDEIKKKTDLAVTLSLGERTKEELFLLREAGADRYLLRFETSNRSLYKRVHPPLPNQKCDRIALLVYLKRLGFEIGSGMLVGLPGQSYEDLALDILMFYSLDLDMIGLGPYIPHPDTPLCNSEDEYTLSRGEQVPNTEEMTYKVLALSRILCPLSNIPVTTAVASLQDIKGYEMGLMCGANVIMKNITPIAYRPLYYIYPNKACRVEMEDSDGSLLRSFILSQNRSVGMGRGDSFNYTRNRYCMVSI